MKYGSVCSGIEAATVAWHPLGWEAQWYSEIEKFPCALLKHHYPNVPNLGDMTKVEKFNGSIDLLVGGTPCQSFSIAGLRGGMADPRGNLALVFLAILNRTRPRWVVWENVPGVLSSNEGRDFGSFIGGLEELGYGFAYRVLDAQYFGVPQRRRRVFVVGYFGDWRRAATVLFERQSLSGDNPPSKEQGKGASEGIAKCLTSRSTQRNNGSDEDFVIANSLNGHSGGNQIEETYVPILSASLKSRDYKGVNSDGNGAENVIVIRTDQVNSNGHGFSENISNTLDGANGQAIAFKERGGCEGGGKGFLASEEKTFTVSTTQDQNLFHKMSVRRLTPEECERLQGFPTGYTKISDKTADGPRYKAIGNSMAVPVMHWIGKRIQMVENIS